MDPQPIQVSEFLVLYRSGGTAFLLISMIGVVLTAIGILSLFTNIRLLVLAGTVVAMLVFVTAVFLLQTSYTKFSALVISGGTPDPNEIANTIVFSIAIGFCSLFSTVIPLSLFVFGLFLQSGNKQRRNES